MAIVVNCQCGKKLKAKDQLAGKTVRCPSCKNPVRIPRKGVSPTGSASGTARNKPHSARPEIDTEEAILRFEEAQKRKQMSAEAEAAYRAEQNKLVESYDQLSGRGGPKSKGTLKGAKAGEKPQKPTLASKLFDMCGAVCGTLLFKYLMIALLLSGGVVGSVYGVKFLTSYMHTATAPSKPKEQRIEELFQKAEAALEAKRWSALRDLLTELIQEQPRLEKHRRYKALKKGLEEGYAAGL